LANSILDRQVSAILIGGSLLVIVGILDDILDVPAIVKLVTQLVAAAIVIGSGVAITLFPRFWFGNFVDAILTIIWLLGACRRIRFSGRTRKWRPSQLAQDRRSRLDPPFHMA
ncbi:MAG TPA: hypothetical protein VF431_01390, partial [Candidatus Methylomirabilis sp.]